MKKYLKIFIMLTILLITINTYAWSTYTNYARIVNLTRNRTPITVHVVMGGDTQYIDSESYESDINNGHFNTLPEKPMNVPWGTSILLEWQSELTQGIYDNTVYIQQLDVAYKDNSLNSSNDTLWIFGEHPGHEPSQGLHGKDNELKNNNYYKLTDSAAGAYVSPLNLACVKEPNDDSNGRVDVLLSHIGFFGGWQSPYESRMTIVFKGDNT